MTPLLSMKTCGSKLGCSPPPGHAATSNPVLPPSRETYTASRAMSLSDPVPVRFIALAAISWGLPGQVDDENSATISPAGETGVPTEKISAPAEAAKPSALTENALTKNLPANDCGFV